MGHYTGPKARINRRLGVMVFESAGAIKASERRNTPPGMAPPQRKLSKYGEAMREKQKIKYYYGLSERQLRRMFDRARRKKGNTGDNLLMLCERRLDNVVRLAGFAKTRPQARQGAAHGHFLVNGVATDIASATLRVGDVVSVKRRPNVFELYVGIATASDIQPANWLSVDRGEMVATVSRLPSRDDVTLPVDIQMVVELLTR
jgi:small subunit ribosomal protein S4